MATLAQIRTAWSSNVFSDASVTAFTTNAFDYDVVEDGTSLGDLVQSGVVNFFTYVAKKQDRGLITGGSNSTRVRYEMEVSYYLEAVPDGTNHPLVLDRMDIVDGLVRTSLGETWGATVDFFDRPQEPPTLSTINIGGKNVWRALQTWVAHELT